MLNGLFDSIHNGDRVGVSSLLKNRHVDRPLSVHPHQTGLDLLGVLRISDIRYPHRRLPHGL